MSRPRPQWQLQNIAAQRRDNEQKKADELRKVANYFENHTNKTRHHEQWTTEDYYERAKKEADNLCEKKVKDSLLEDRRKKLEMMLFQENMKYQEELRCLAAQPKFFKNGSYLSKVPTETLKEINQGIVEKEEQLRQHEAELRLHHAWRLRQPELRAASSYIANGKLKSAWMEQIVEKEMQKKKDEEENYKILLERDEALRQQIQIEEEKLRAKEKQMIELRGSLEGQISELSEKESAVKILRKQEEREIQILQELKYISSEREKEFARLISERDATIINMGLHKYKLKKKVLCVLKEIELEVTMLEKIRNVVMSEQEFEQEKCSKYKRILDEALRQLDEHRERDRLRQKNIEAMYDGEARQINEKQDKLWAREQESRSLLMAEVMAALKKQMEQKIELNRQRQKENVLEREKILDQMESYNQEVKSRERQTQLKNSSYSTINALQSQLNSLKLNKERALDAQKQEEAIRSEMVRERNIRSEIAKAQRLGHVDAWT